MTELLGQKEMPTCCEAMGWTDEKCKWPEKLGQLSAAGRQALARVIARFG